MAQSSEVFKLETFLAVLLANSLLPDVSEPVASAAFFLCSLQPGGGSLSMCRTCHRQQVCGPFCQCTTGARLQPQGAFPSLSFRPPLQVRRPFQRQPVHVLFIFVTAVQDAGSVFLICCCIRIYPQSLVILENWYFIIIRHLVVQDSGQCPAWLLCQRSLTRKLPGFLKV